MRALLRNCLALIELDISGLAKRDGENVLRWVPGTQGAPAIPELQLMWTE